MKKIMEFQEEYSKLQYPVQSDSLRKILEQGVAHETPDIGEQMHQTMTQLLKFPYDKVFPCIDLYRMYLMHPTSSAEFTKSDMGAGQVSTMLNFLLAKNVPNPVYYLTLRSLCNYFKNQSSNHVAMYRWSEIFDAVSKHLSSADKHTRLAAAFLYCK